MGSPTSGNKRDKLIRDALTVAVNRIHEGDPQGRRKLALAAAAIVEKAVDGDIQAFNTIADRIDGKPHQSMDITNTHERPVNEWDERDIDLAIAKLGDLARKETKGAGTKKPDPVH